MRRQEVGRDVSKRRGLEATWGSHLPIVFRCLEQTKGPVLECGVGAWSTPFLHIYCAAEGRELYSFEHDPEWYWAFTKDETETHHMGLVEKWADVGIIDTEQWSVALLDHGPSWGQRRQEAKRLKDNTECVILHDTHPHREKYFRYNRIYGLYKYRFDYDKWSAWSTVLSNLRDLSGLS